MTLMEIAKLTKEASTNIMNASTQKKNDILEEIACLLKSNEQRILEANAKDMMIAKVKGTAANLIDRMMLDTTRLDAIIEGVRQVKELDDPIGEIIDPHTLENGLKIVQMRVALGVVGMIYEARPNVSVDATVLCIKTGNAVILRGSKDILNTNKVLVNTMKEAIKKCDMSADILHLVEDTSREVATEFMRLHGYLDVLIPRGGAALIQSCIEHASVPLLETGTGNCHIYVDKDADFKKAYAIIQNAKTQRTSVCNACESLLLHKDIVEDFTEKLLRNLKSAQVIMHGDETVCAYDEDVILASDEDYGKEYLALEVSIKVVSSLEEAIAHINQYSTHHSESIISENREAIMSFLAQIDSACVYANASTRFSDGFVFGLGAEIGISTQKLHARGPMGLHALTSLKYLIQGNGQIR